MPPDGTPGNDSLDGTSGSDTIFGFAGADSLFLGDGADEGYGGAGDDSLYGGDGNDLLLGDVRGNPGDDILEGGAGRDTLNGRAGNDLLFGGSGNDELRDEGGTATFDGGDGVDTIVLDTRGLTDSILTLVVDLALGTQGAVELQGDDDVLISIENYTYAGAFNTSISGDDQANRLLSSAGTDTLSGRDGADLLDAGGRADRLFGGNGRDIVIGGRGNDSQSGGDGVDRFVFGTDDGRDRINDFDAVGPDHDVLDLRALSAIVGIVDLRTNHMSQVGSNVVIRAGDDRIVLVDVNIGQLGSADFLF